MAASEKFAGNFKRLHQLDGTYFQVLPHRGGLLLARIGGIDFFDGIQITPILNKAASGTYFAYESSTYPNRLYLLNGFDLTQLIAHTDGTYSHIPVVRFPDACNSICEGTRGQLIVGTFAKGAFTLDPDTKRLATLCDPATDKPLGGQTIVTATKGKVILFSDEQVFVANREVSRIQKLDGIPKFLPINIEPMPDEDGLLVAFANNEATFGLAQSLGTLGFDPIGNAVWKELDIRNVKRAGFIRAITFSKENGRRILWVGGTEGLLRIDFDSVSTVQAPKSPQIRLDAARSSNMNESAQAAFHFRDHRVSIKAFTGDYSHRKDWLFQARLGTENTEWSPPSTRRSFEFTNLSQGDYRFEVRTINSANLTSAPASFAFTILPPWYRSSWAYSGYVASLIAATAGFVRIREGRSRARQRELERMVDDRTRELVKANAAKDEFIASVSHEIRNPMNGVLGIAESFRNETLDPESRHKLGLLRQCANHLSSLLEDILDFSRVQTGIDDLEAKPFPLRETLDSVIALTASTSTNQGIPVEVAVAPKMPRHLIGDARRVRQILLNLVDNALKYGGRGQVYLTVWGQETSPALTQVFFSVYDEGPGIPAEQQQKLFTRFERGPAARFGRVPGSGLGLALCKSLAEKMGGRIWLESEVGKGSCFYFSAPFPTAVDPAPAPAESVTAAGERFHTALVVDDEEYNRVALTGLLENLGIAVRAAVDGTDAGLQARDHDFDLIFLDYALPGQSGPEVARHIRELGNRSARAQLIGVTAFSTPDKKVACLAAGMDAVINKPVTMHRLRQALGLSAASTPPDCSPRPGEPGNSTNPLGNLQRLAAQKQTSFAAEFSSFLAELDAEISDFGSALQQENAARIATYSHLLGGRCAFVNESGLGLELENTASASASGRADDARRLGRTAQAGLAALRIKLAAQAPGAPPGSSH